MYDINNPSDVEGERASTLEVYAWFVAKEKAIYNALNMMKVRGSTYLGFLWAPLEREQAIQEALAQFSSTEFKTLNRGPDGDMKFMPPTFIKTNDVSWVLQQITDTYGVPSYKEANPAAFSIVSFPFLFAVMFGDYGHGSLIFFLGAVMTLFHDRLKHTPMAAAQPLRYIFLMMGMFSIYNGLLYNEFFAIPNDWFGSCFETSTRYSRGELCEGDVPCDLVYLPKNCENPSPGALNCWNECVYPFGVDPAWYLSPQLLNFTNNMKMKISVIIGVWHMTMGVCVKGFNAVFFKQPLTLIFEVFTGVIIMLGLVGWMDFLIFTKWTFSMQAYSSDPIEIEKIKLAPSIITVMINNILAGG